MQCTGSPELRTILDRFWIRELTSVIGKDHRNSFAKSCAFKRRINDSKISVTDREVFASGRKGSIRLVSTIWILKTLHSDLPDNCIHLDDMDIRILLDKLQKILIGLAGAAGTIDLESQLLIAGKVLYFSGKVDVSDIK